MIEMRELKRILKEMELLENVINIEESENKNMFYQKVFTIYFKEHDDTAKVILNAYNEKEFKLNNYEKDIKRQINEQLYLFNAK